MSDQFRKFNQSSSQVSLHDVQPLKQMFNKLPSELSPTDSDEMNIVVTLPDLSQTGSTKHKRPTPENRMTSGKSLEAAEDNCSVSKMDAIIGDPATDFLDGLSRSEFDLKTELDRNKKDSAQGFQLQELPGEPAAYPAKNVTPATERPLTTPHRRIAKATSQTSSVTTREKVPACLGLAVSTRFAEPEPQLIRRIIARQDKLGCQILLFADVDSPERVASVCVQFALEIMAAKPLRTLVIDADATDQTLTRKVSQTSEAGWRECLLGETRISEHIMPTERSGVGFLAAGLRNIDFNALRTNIPSGAEQLVADLRNEYDLICVSLGTAFSSSLTWWGKTCDLSFLSLNPISTGRSLARLAVQELQQNGARLEGCIISYTESP